MKDYLINILTDDEKKAYLQSTNKLITNLKNAQFPNGWQKKGNYKYTSTLFWFNSIHVNPVADGQTFITDFIPINKPSMFIMSRQSNHPKGSDGNTQKRQTRGIPNVFRDIYFFPSNDYISNDGTVVIINSNHLYNDSDCQQIREAMINMYQNGTFVHPFIADASKQEPMTFTNGIPDVNRISNQSRKGQKKITNKKGNIKKGGKGGNNTPSAPVQPRLNRENTMKKNTIRLNENTIRQIVAESVKKVLKEGIGDFTDYNGVEFRKKLDSALSALEECVFYSKKIDFQTNEFFNHLYDELYDFMVSHQFMPDIAYSTDYDPDKRYDGVF